MAVPKRKIPAKTPGGLQNKVFYLLLLFVILIFSVEEALTRYSQDHIIYITGILTLSSLLPAKRNHFYLDKIIQYSLLSYHQMSCFVLQELPCSTFLVLEHYWSLSDIYKTWTTTNTCISVWSLDSSLLFLSYIVEAC